LALETSQASKRSFKQSTYPATTSTSRTPHFYPLQLKIAEPSERFLMNCGHEPRDSSPSGEQENRPPLPSSPGQPLREDNSGTSTTEAQWDESGGAGGTAKDGERGRGVNRGKAGGRVAGDKETLGSADRSRSRRRHRRHDQRSHSRRGRRHRSESRSHRRHSRSPPRYRDRSRRRRPRHEDDFYDPYEEERIRREETERDAGRFEGETPAENGVKFKGRGSMKYREKKSWGYGGGYGRLN